jgi:hypothetical protein
VTACGVEAPNRLADRPKLLSPRFAQMFNARGYRALKRDKFRMHFQYLMASRLLVEYDYFKITAGATTFALRFVNTPGVVDYDGSRPFGSRRA